MEKKHKSPIEHFSIVHLMLLTERFQTILLPNNHLTERTGDTKRAYT